MIEVNGINLNYRDVGYGHPVVLLHGYGQSNRVFLEIERYLLLSHRVILIDSRGHGLSERGLQPVSIPLMASDTAALLDALGIARAAVVGFSDGANIALQLAVDFPNYVSSVTAISGNSRPEGLKRFYRDFINMRKNIREFLGWDVGMMDLLTSQPKMTNTQLGTIHVPALLIYGSRDIIEKSHISELNKVIPISNLLTVRGASHFSIIGKWRKYIGSIEQWILYNE